MTANASSDQRDPQIWGSRTGFLLATIGSAVGIGSIWKFPYEVGANGGGTFVVFYVLGLVLVVVPLMVVELMIGRRGASDAATSLANVAASEGLAPRWRVVGLLGALAAFLILSYYAVIAGWMIAYAVDTAIDGLPPTTDAATADFDALLASPASMVAYQVVFLAIVLGIVVRGVQRGIELAMKILVPVLVVLLVMLAGYSMASGAVAETLRFLFVPDFDQFDAGSALEALGLGFFSIGVGLGLMITYGAYSPPKADLKRVAISAVIADTAISIVAGFAVFPIVFAQGTDPAGGPGLVFLTLPRAFANMPGGRVAAVAFFVLLVVAAAGSAVSLLEAAASVLSHRLGLGRARAAIGTAIACGVVGLATVLSFNRWEHRRPLGAIDRFASHTVYDLIDEATSNLMLPLGGLALALFGGWLISERLIREELALGPWQLRLLRFALRFAVPVTIVATVVASFTGD